MQMPKRPTRYHSFLLRCWDEDGAGWRFMLENPHNGEKQGFGSYKQLVAFLEGELAGSREPTYEKGPGP